MKFESPYPSVTKVPTGIQGFDEVTDGGLPSGRTTLVMGAPGPNIEDHFGALRAKVDEHDPQCVVIDPLSAWIHVSYIVQDGERNRALTIVEGVGLTDVFVAQGKAEAVARLQVVQTDMEARS